MDFRDQGVLLAVRRHGETSAIIEVFTAANGRYLGVVRGGGGRRMAPVLQPGAQLDVTWRARLAEHIGSFTAELIRSRAADIMADRVALAGLNAMTALLSFTLPEREAHGGLYARTIAVLDMLGHSPAWPLAYLRWELALLDEMGFGLDLSACAVTGAGEGLAYVSPKTGRAVSAGAAGEWADKLLPLPASLLGEGSGAPAEVAGGMVTTGWFLEHHLAPSLGDKPLPAARRRLHDLLARG